MGEQARAELSVFFRLDSGIVEHNNREFIAKSIVRERMPDNITYKRENIREFTMYYSDRLKDFNENQKRKERIIPDYYKYIR